MPIMKLKAKFASGKKGWGNFWLVLVLAIVFSIFAYFYLIKPQGPFCWDEAHHSTFSLLIAKSLLQRNWPAFWHYTNVQIYWPFLHSWISSIFLMIFGFSYRAARFTNVIIGFIAILLIYKAGLKLSSHHKPWVGLLAAVLMVLSPMFLFFCSMAMIENLGLLISLLLILFQFTALEKGEMRYYFISGLLLALLYLTKYIYALFFGLALFCFWLSLLFPADREIKKMTVLKGIGWVAAGFLLIWGIWMVIPPSGSKFSVLLYRIKDTGVWNPYEFTKLDNRFFFLRALLYAYTFSIGIYLLYLGSLVYGFIKFKNVKIRFLLFLFLADFIPMSWIVNSQIRFIYTVIPALFLLTASFVVWIWSVLSPRKRWVALAIISVLILGDAPKLPSYIRQVGNLCMGACPFKIKSKFDYSTFFGLASYPEFLRFPKKFFNQKARDILPRHDTGDILDFVWGNTNPRASICAPFYIGTLSNHLWHWHSIIKNRQIATVWRPDYYYFVSVQVDDSSPYHVLGNKHLIEGRTAEWDKFLSNLESQGLMKLAGGKYFPDIGLKVKIYLKSEPLNNPVWRQLKFP